MSKLTKHAEVINQLQKMVLKKAEEAQTNISGKPGIDVKEESVPAEHDHIDKNKVVPEHNSGGDDKTTQGFTQKPSDKPSEPAANPKKASDLGSEILNEIRKNATEAQKDIKGEAGADVVMESSHEKNDHIDKNTVKTENNDGMTGKEQQGWRQAPALAKAEAPAEHAKKAATDEKTPEKATDTPDAKIKKEDKEVEKEEEAVKVASYELGRQLAIGLLKKQAAAQPSIEMLKEAGRRDFDILISQAAEKLGYEDDNVKQAEELDALAEKQAEEAGAAYCDQLMKEAALEALAAENEEMKEKMKKMEEEKKEHEKEKDKEASSKEKAAEMAKLAEMVTANVIAALKKDVEPAK